MHTHKSKSAYSGVDIMNMSKLLKILAKPDRLRILCGLGLECRPDSDIVTAMELSQTNVSFHLRVLREAGLV